MSCLPHDSTEIINQVSTHSVCVSNIGVHAFRSIRTMLLLYDMIDPFKGVISRFFLQAQLHYRGLHELLKGKSKIFAVDLES